MYIICPKCTTNFVIEESQIGNSGRKVRCSKCMHIWFVNSDSKIKIDYKKENIIPSKKDTQSITPETRFYDGDARLLPTIINQEDSKKSNLCFYKWTAVVLGLLFIILIDMVDFGQFIFSNDFSVEGMKVVSISDNKVKVYCTIVNNSQKSAMIPIIRYRFYDKNNKIITRRLVENNISKLEPKQSINITREFDIKPVKLDITLGSKLDFLMRY